MHGLNRTAGLLRNPLRTVGVALTIFAGATTVTLAVPQEAAAFCGFYVAGADAKLYNNATMVVLMRDGTRTVLSMPNNYQGPPQDFAMVVPVPVVPARGRRQGAPGRGVRSGRQARGPAPGRVLGAGPLPAHRTYADDGADRVGHGRRDDAPPSAPPADLGVTIEAQFEVGEYQVVILSAKESTGLDTWLRQEKYNIPAGAQPLLEPYVQSGSKFFVAKVDSQEGRVRRAGPGQAVAAALPLRLARVRAAGPARADQRPGRPGSARPHPRPQRPLRGRQLRQRRDPDQPRGQGRGPRALWPVLCLAVRPHPEPATPRR